jgi:hypothetical protein
VPELLIFEQNLAEETQVVRRCLRPRRIASPGLPPWVAVWTTSEGKEGAVQTEGMIRVSLVDATVYSVRTVRPLTQDMTLIDSTHDVD